MLFARLAVGESGFAAGEGLLQRVRLLALLPGLALSLAQQLVSLLFGFEEGFLLASLGIPLGFLRDAQRLFLGASDRFSRDAPAIRHPDCVHGGRRDDSDDGVDDVTEYRQHA